MSSKNNRRFSLPGIWKLSLQVSSCETSIQVDKCFFDGFLNKKSNVPLCISLIVEAIYVYRHFSWQALRASAVLGLPIPVPGGGDEDKAAASSSVSTIGNWNFL